MNKSTNDTQELFLALDSIFQKCQDPLEIHNKVKTILSDDILPVGTRKIDNGTLVRFIGMVTHDSLDRHYIHGSFANHYFRTSSNCFSSKEEEEAKGDLVDQFQSVTMVGLVKISPLNAWSSKEIYKDDYENVLEKVRCVVPDFAYPFDMAGNMIEYKLHQIIEVVGILEWPLNNHDDTPTIITIQSRMYNEHGSLYSIFPSRSLTWDSFSFCLEEQLIRDFDKYRNDIIHYLAILFNNDKVLAEYLLLLFISKIDKRIVGLMDNLSLGNIALNLQFVSDAVDPQFIESYICLITEVFNELLVNVKGLPLTLHSLESYYFSPTYTFCENDQGFECQGIELEAPEAYLRVPIASELQLANGTLLMVDETGLETGTLKENAVRNVKTLGCVIEKQMLTLKAGYDISVPVDFPILVISHHSKSIFKLPFCYKFKLTPNMNLSEMKEKLSYFPESWRGLARKYICKARIVTSYISDDLAKVAEAEFSKLAMEEKDIKNDLTRPLAFHYQLTVARLMSSSYFKDRVDESHLSHAQKLEHHRRVFS